MPVGCWCFGGRGAPHITHDSGLALQPMIPDIPMPTDPEELEDLFADLVDELDLDKPHREAMFSLPPEKKWQIYCSKRQELEDGSNTIQPDGFIEKVNALSSSLYLSQSSIDEALLESGGKTMEGLKAALRTQPLRFVTRFIDREGLECLLNFLSHMDKQVAIGAIHTSAIGCIKALMNNSYSRSHVLAHPTCINTIAQSLACDNIKTKVAVLEIYGALCMIPKGHLKVLEGMVHFQRYHAERTRFQTLMYDLDRSYMDFNLELELKTAIMGFINAIIKYGPGQEHYEFRMHLRYEFLMLGIVPIMDKLRGFNNDMLERHLDFFEMIRNQDEREFAEKFDLSHVDSKSAGAMLDILKKRLGMSVAYTHLLSILFHLLQMPTNSYMPQYWQLIDRIVQQIVLQQKDGSNTDDAPLEINVNKIVKLLASENEIKAVQTKIRETQKENDELTGKLSKKERECEIKDEEKDELMEMVDKMKTKMEQEVYHHTNTKQQLEATQNELNQLKSLLEAERGERQKFEHLVKTGSLPDDAKANIKAAAAILKPTPAAPPPAAPPPPPKMGGPPAPPPPPGAPPVPGFPGSGPKGIGLRQKKIPQPANPLKSFNWTKLPDSKITGTVWMEIDDTKLFRVLDLDEFEKMFSAYQRHSSEDEDTFAKTIKQQKNKELSVVDGRRAQNCNILLSKLKMRNDEIARAIMSMDSQEELPKDMCEQLLKFVPTPEEKQMLEEHEHEIDEMARADRFLYDMSRIMHYEQRLNALYYKKKFSERMGECKPKIEAVLLASRQIVQSRRLKKLLEIVLAYGNYMNRGQRGNASGFKLVSLNKIQDTKSCMDRKITFLHYLLQVMEKKFPEVLRMEEEIVKTRDAAKVSLVDLDQEITVLRDGLKTIQQELSFHRTLPYDGRDKFVGTMKNFVTVASIKFQEMEENITEMRTRYDRARKTFAEEQMLQPEDFFGIFDQFLVSMEEAKRENENFKRLKDEEEKRAKIEAQMKAERQKRTMEKQRSLSSAGTGEQNAGEFDELISALKSGDCFGEDLAKFKRNRRRGSQPANMDRERVGPVNKFVR